MQRSLCVTQRELHARRIQELGTLPPTSELQKYRGFSITALMRELEKTNKKLKGYSHVNKKAFDQFVNFNEQREALLKRKEEVDKGAKKVKELIESLDRQKDEAINRTFRGVSAHFKDVFKELVPNGAGELIMKTSLDEDDTDEVLDEEEIVRRRQNPSVNKYRGIGIKVRFSDVGENYLMSQLSGGQKSLVAMALIFAIQRCDPAPFYLFDELDQALDSTYRKAVAGLIQRQANSKENPTQFICSTFRPELVAISNRCYGISHQDKVSNIYHLSKKDALKFIANLMSEEEAVGEVTSLATSKASHIELSKKRKAITAPSLSEDEDEESKDAIEAVVA
jgi:structural maintenance of chromosome 3 (chondroitin sulfate proteoglycan 6)